MRWCRASRARHRPAGHPCPARAATWTVSPRLRLAPGVCSSAGFGQAEVGADEVQPHGRGVRGDEDWLVAGVVVALHDQFVDAADLAVLSPDDVVGVLEGVQRVEYE